MKQSIQLFIAALSISLTAACQAGERYALVIGVNACPDFEVAKGVPARPLRGAEADARAMALLLQKDFGFPEANIELLTGEKATFGAVKQAVSRLRQKAGRDDCAAIYFSGHGTQVPDVTPLDESDDRLDEALCLADSDSSGKNLLVDDELGRWLDQFDVAQLSIIIDCCHSGTATKDDDDEFAARYLPFPGIERTSPQKWAWREVRPVTKSLTGRRTAFFACQPYQQAYERRFPGEDAPFRGGLFTQYLLLGVSQMRADADQDGVLSSAEIIAFVRAQLDKTFNTGRKDEEQQRPLLESDDPDAPAIVGRVADGEASDSKASP